MVFARSERRRDSIDTLSAMCVPFKKIHVRCAVVVLFLASVVSSTARADSPPNVNWNNPFCASVGALFPWNRERNALTDGATDTYYLSLWSSAVSSFSTRITMVDSYSAFTVQTLSVTIPKDKVGHNLRWPFLVQFDHPVSISQFFVDAVSIDGGSMTDCPSFVQSTTVIKNWTGAVPQPSDFGHATAHFLQRLPALPCGRIFSPIKPKAAFSPMVGRYGATARSTDVEVFVDSSGRIADTRVWRSSGVDGIDATALGAAQFSTYEPAQFLCTPVVGYGIFRLDYKP